MMDEWMNEHITLAPAVPKGKVGTTVMRPDTLSAETDIHGLN